MICPFCGSEAVERPKRKVEVNGKWRKVAPKRKWICPGCRRVFAGGGVR